MSNTKILVIDDNPKNVQLLVEILLKNEYDIMACMSGEEALEVLHDFQPELILLDIMMPELDGFEVCKILKKQEDTKEIPIIFITAKNEIDDIIEGFKLGAVDYITKPFNTEELLVRIQTQIKILKQQDKIQKISQERESLLQILSHDLVNPLGTVRNFLGLLETGKIQFNPRILKAMSDAINNAYDTIELVRQQRAIASGKFSLNLKPVYLKDMLTKSLNLLKEQIDHKKLYVKVDVEPNLLIKVDETSFVNTVLNNLLTNAIKFSYESGDIEIRTSKGNKPNKLLLELKDYGIGIPQKLLQDIFDPTKKTHRPGTWQEKGTGFGMPLVKNLMEAYGGEVQLDSRSIEEHPESHGTSVFLHLEVDSLYK